MSNYGERFKQYEGKDKNRLRRLKLKWLRYAIKPITTESWGSYTDSGKLDLKARSYY